MQSRIAVCLVAAAAIASAGCAVTASAQPYGRGGWGSSWQRAAYENGFREGLIAGERAARSRRTLDYHRERVYRDADRGYDRRFGPRGQYRQAFRSGFEQGFRDGYGRYAYTTPRRGPGRVVPYGGYGYGYDRDARQRGFDDGFEKGREDARDGDRYDARRHKWYREGDRGYKREFGPREVYERVYRDAFLEGYERGYRGSVRGYDDRRW